VFDALLLDKGIRLQQSGSGDHYTTCPQCSHLRKPANRKKRCLSVTIKADGAVFHCHNCGWSGGVSERQAEREARREERPAPSKPRGRDYRSRVKAGSW
jgi:twinkle protein